MTNKVKAAKFQLGWLVNRMHVSATADDIRAELWPRMTDALGWTDKDREQAITYAVQQHERNRNLYRRVSRGTV